VSISFVEARHRLEAKDRSHRDKTTTLDVALEDVNDGDHVAIGGCLYSRTPMAALLGLLRRRPTDLTLSRSLMCYEGELYLAAGASRHLMTSWMAIGLRWGLPPVMRRYVEGGKATYEEWSHLALGLRYKAGGMGVPFLPSVTMLGSDLAGRVGTKEMDCPFTGERLQLIPALFPEVALIHAHRADPFGNVQIDGYPHMDADIARAAQTVIVTVEEVVDSDEIARDGARTAIPHFMVDHVVEVPFGSYPHELYGRYDADFEHFDEYVALTRTDGGIESYLDERVYGVADHDEFLALFGDGRLESARRRAAEVLS